METKLVVFKNKQIRRVLHNDEWWFSVVDVCGALADSRDAGKYWRKLKQRLKKESNESVTFCHGLKLPAPDGKLRQTDCANTEGIFRIIQSIPSPKAEPSKRWLAKVGYERVQEIENQELAGKRTRAIYRAKGYSDDWIEKRMRGIVIRVELTDEWKKRDVKGDEEYAILTSEINKAAQLTALGVKPAPTFTYSQKPRGAPTGQTHRSAPTFGITCKSHGHRFKLVHNDSEIKTLQVFQPLANGRRM